MSLFPISESQNAVTTNMNYIASLVSGAETQFWNGCGFQHSVFGSINSDPWDIAGDISSSIETLVDQTLDRIADMTGDTKAAWDWTTSKNAIYPAIVSTVYQRIYQIMSEIGSVTNNAPPDFDVRTDLAATLGDLYDQAEAALQDGLGPYFPGVRTSFWPLADAVKIKVEEDTDLLRLFLLDSSDTEIEWNGSGAITGWNAFAVGDIVRIDTLDVSGLTDTYTGASYEITQVDTGATPHIEIEAIGVILDAPMIEGTSDEATVFGNGFRIRKIKGA